jgi:hypothetical protein
MTMSTARPRRSNRPRRCRFGAGCSNLARGGGSTGECS